MPDGSKFVYAQSDGNTVYPRRLFLTKVVDPQGNAVTLTYDAQMRLTSVTDAIGQSSTLQYANTQNPLLITSITDPFGRAAQIGYDANGRLNALTDVIGMQSQLNYDSGTSITSMTTPYGTTQFSVGQNGRQRWLEVTDPAGQKERVEFFETAPGIPYSDPVAPTNIGCNCWLNYRNTFYWDKTAMKVAAGDYTQARIRHWLHDLMNSGWSQVSGTMESIKYPLENRIWYAYPGQTSTIGNGTLDKPAMIGRVLDDGSTQTTQLSYNNLGNVTRRIDPQGRETDYVYATNLVDLLQVKQKTATGFDTIAQYTYNSQHLPLTYTDAAGQTTSYTYNPAGQLTKVVNPLKESTQYQYDSNGYLQSVIDANSKTLVSYTYDTFGRVATQTDSEGLVKAFNYDALDRLTSTTYMDGTQRKQGWNKLDLASVTDRLNNTTLYNYDANRNLISATDPLNNVTQYNYYENGQLRTLTDPNGNLTQWTRDIEGRVTAKTFPDSKQTQYGYDSASRLITQTDALGQVRSNSYTIDDRLGSVSYANALNPTPTVSFSYDSAYPRVTGMTDGSGTTTYSYVPVGSLGANQLAQEGGPDGASAAIQYSYDKLSRVSGRTVAGASESFTRDKLGRVITHSNPLDKFDTTYLGETDQVAGQTQGKGQGKSYYKTTWQYLDNTNDRRLAAILHPTSNSSQGARDIFYSTDAENRVTARHDWPLGQHSQYSYDAANRLTGSQDAVWDGGDVPADPGFPNSSVLTAYGYDAATNLLSKSLGSTVLGTTSPPQPAWAATVNSNNQLAQVNGASWSYDANGNLLDDGSYQYAWDAENRLVKLTNKQSGHVSGFRYDGLWRRIAITEQDANGTPGETRYLWCGDTLCAARDTQGNVTSRYYPQGEQWGGTQNVFYARDHLGSVMQLVDAKDNLLGSVGYDAYGNTTSSTGLVAQFGYAGMLRHGPSGLYLTKYRAYSPASGRWVSRDPIGEAGGVNLYAYVDGSPTNLTDSVGLWSVTVGAFPGVGGQFSFGQNPNGSGFMSVQFGWGIGGGFTYNPLGQQPGYSECQGASWGIGTGVYGQAGLRAGPVGASIGANLGRNFRSTGSELYGGLTKSGGLKDRLSGVNASISGGGQITVFGGGSAKGDCTCGR